MMVALPLYGYCQGGRSSRVIEKRCVRDAGYRVITSGLHPDHATIARFRARHEEALGGLFSQVLRLLAAEGMVSLGVLSLDGTKLAGNAARKANKTLPQIEKLLAEAAQRDAAEDARYGDAPGEPTPRTLARRAGRRERLAAARDRLAAEDAARRAEQRAKQAAWDAAAAARRPRAARRPADEPRTNPDNTPPRANITGPDCRVMRNQKGLRGRVQRPARGHRAVGHGGRDAVLAPGRPHLAAPAAGHLPPPGGSLPRPPACSTAPPPLLLYPHCADCRAMPHMASPSRPSAPGWILAVAWRAHRERVPRHTSSGNAGEEVGGCRQPSGTGSMCAAVAWASRSGQARSSRSAGRAGSRPT